MKFLAIAAAVIAGLYLAWDWFAPSGTLRYRLTLEVDVDGKSYSGSGVIEVRYEISPRWMPGANRVVSHVRGEAVAVELGGRGILFSLLRGVPVEETTGYVASAAAIPVRELNLAGSIGSLEEASIRKIGSIKVRAEIPFSRLPMMVRFRDLDDPKGVERVNPGDLAASFGSGTRLQRVVIETTRDGVTTGIESRLRWLKGLMGYLDGSRLGHSASLPNTLTAADFRWGF